MWVKSIDISILYWVRLVRTSLSIWFLNLVKIESLMSRKFSLTCGSQYQCVCWQIKIRLIAADDSFICGLNCFSTSK